MARQKFILISVVFLMVLIIIVMPTMDACSETKYPNKAIDIIVITAPGGGADLLGRITAEYLRKELKQPINIINRYAGDGIPGVESVLKAAPDGYTLLGENQTSSSGKVIVKGWPFKLEDHTYIARIAGIPMSVVVRSDIPWKSLADFKNALQAPGAENLIWAALGRGTTADYTMYQFFNAIGFDHSKIRMVQFQTQPLAAAAMAGGNAHFGALNAGTALPFLRAGKIRILAVTAPHRMNMLPDISTTKEEGYPEVDAMIWFGLSGPKGLNPEVIDILNNALQKVLRDPAMLKTFTNIGAEPVYLGPSEFKTFVFNDAEKVKKLLGRDK